MTLFDLDSSTISSLPLEDVIAAAKETPGFTGADQLEKMLAPEIVDIVVKFIQRQKDMKADAPTIASVREGIDQFVPKEPGFKHVDYKEAQNPQEALKAAGYTDKKEALAMLESIRRDLALIELGKKEHDDREAECVRREQVVIGRERSCEEKSRELLDIKLSNRAMLDDIAQQRAKLSSEKSSIS